MPRKVQLRYQDRPVQHRAHGLIQMRVRKGRVARPAVCGQCGKECKPDAHHDDYTKPGEVLWLCRPCHYKRHLEIRKRVSSKD